MQQIPAAAVASQTFTVSLGGQNCRFAIYQRSTGLFMDLSVNNVPIVTGSLCRDRTAIVRSAYIGFVGDIAFLDTQGGDDPVYTGIGSRFVLVYFSPSELVPFQIV